MELFWILIGIGLVIFIVWANRESNKITKAEKQAQEQEPQQPELANESKEEKVVQEQEVQVRRLQVMNEETKKEQEPKMTYEKPKETRERIVQKPKATYESKEEKFKRYTENMTLDWGEEYHIKGLIDSKRTDEYIQQEVNKIKLKYEKFEGEKERVKRYTDDPTYNELEKNYIKKLILLGNDDDYILKEIDNERIKREKRLKIQKDKEDKFNNMMSECSQLPVVLSDEPCEFLDVNDMPDVTYSTITKNMIKDNFGDFVVIDTETTGLSPKTKQIVEISAVRFIEFLPAEYMTTLVNPQSKIPENITEINNITDDMVKDSPLINQVAKSFIDFIGKEKIIVGHNVEFDLKFWYANGINLFESKRKYFDTVTFASSVLKKYDQKEADRAEERGDYHFSDFDVDDYQLSTLIEHYDFYTPAQHRGLNDCISTGQLFVKLIEEKLE